MLPILYEFQHALNLVLKMKKMTIQNDEDILKKKKV